MEYCSGLKCALHQYSLAGQTNWPIANALIKVSICLTFIRIFITKPFRTAATTVYLLSIGWSLATILFGYLFCTPLSKLWTAASFTPISALVLAMDPYPGRHTRPSARSSHMTSFRCRFRSSSSAGGRLRGLFRLAAPGVGTAQSNIYISTWSGSR